MLDTTSTDARTRLAQDAAERVFNAEKGESPEYVEPDDELTATIAVGHLRQLFDQLPGTMKSVLASARASGELLSRDRFQGIAEVLQNADDLGATEVQLQLRAADLLFAHNGTPVTLTHVVALATPWLSTKAEEASATGRFGIGLTALQSLSEVLEVHCHPYRLRIGEPTIDVAAVLSPRAMIGGPGWTTLRIPLDRGTLDISELEIWFEHWDDSALLFLRSVSKVTLHDHRGQVIRTLELQPDASELVHATEFRAGTPIVRQRVMASDGRAWLTYSADPPAPRGVRRTRKATGTTSPVAVALEPSVPGSGHLYAGLPLVSIGIPCRINAQFDPLTNRNDLANTRWNQALYAIVAELWTEALLDFFKLDPASAWWSIPIESDSSTADEPQSTPSTELAAAVLHAARTALASRLTFPLKDGSMLPLSAFAVESAQLEGVIEPDEVAALAGLRAAFPAAARDADGRWREVLRDWRDAGAPLRPEIGVQDALVLLSDENRSPEATVRLTSAVLAAELEDELDDLNCIVIEDGTHVPPPELGDAVAVSEQRIPLAEELGLVRSLHPAYKSRSRHSTSVLRWLRERGAILDEGDPVHILERLAALGRGEQEPIELSDRQLQFLRDAFEQVPVDDREQLGTDIGRAILLAVFEHAPRKRRKRSLASPAEAYLPTAIDREPDSFAVAAAQTPGILWLDPRYRDLLRSSQGRQGLGAQRFLRLLGAQIAPRLRPHPALLRRYPSDTRRGLSTAFGPGNIPERVAALRALGAAYTLEDRDSPDLLAVVTNIARERRATQRRRRTAALLSTLGRAWDRIGDFSEMRAVTDHRGWVPQGQVRAFWLWQAASIPWLDNAAGKPCRADDLRVRTDATLAIYGRDPAGYLHPDLDSGNRREALAALGVHGEPTTEELVDRLRDLRDGSDPASAAEWRALHTETSVVYQALSYRLASGSPATDMNRTQLRRAFSQGDGLILVNRQWRKPSEVRRGLPFLGEYVDFVPQVGGTEQLWLILEVNLPDFDDCIDVLRKVARKEDDISRDDESVALETLRFLVAEAGRTKLSERERRALRTLPLATSRGWTRERPVYGIDSPQLAEALADLIPVWRPGGELEQFHSILESLRVTVLPSSSFEVIGKERAVANEDQTHIARLAAAHLRADLDRNAPDLSAAIEVGWDRLQQLEVMELPDLALRTLDPSLGKLPPIEITTWLDVDAGTIFVRDPRALPRAAEGGRIVASLFPGYGRAVAQAWRVAWDAAQEGRDAERIRTARETAEAEAKAAAADIRARTEAFQTRVERRDQPVGARGQVTLQPSTPSAPRDSGSSEPPRRLVDPNTLRLSSPSGRTVDPNVQASAGAGAGNVDGQPIQRRVFVPRSPTPGGARPNAQAGPREYTENEKESLGLELVRWLLSSDESEIVDIRGQRGVGADAVDDLARFYELKVSAGEEPNLISLTGPEFIRASTTEDYFLVVVSGLEGAEATPRIRVVVDPLRQLRPVSSGNVLLTGVRDAGGIVYDFEKDREIEK